MRLRLNLALLLGLSVSAPDRASAASEGGVWWNSLTRPQKVVFVAGFGSGVIHGYNLKDGALILVHPTFDPEYSRRIVEAANKTQRQINHEFGRPTSQIVAGLDTIYADDRNTMIDVNEAIVVVVRSMDGSSDAKIADLLEPERKEASK